MEQIISEDKENQKENQEQALAQMLKRGLNEKSAQEDKALLEKVVTYVQYKDLIDFGKDDLFNTNVEEFIKQTLEESRITDQEEWHKQFECIEKLRKINKYHNDVLMQNIISFAPFLKDSINNLRSGISKNVLIFTTEFFGNKEQMKETKFQSTIIEVLDVVMSSIVYRTAYEKGFVAKEAKNTMNAILESCPYDEVVLAIIKTGCNANNRTLQENSYNYLSTFVKNAPCSYFSKANQQENNQAIIKLVNQLYTGIEGIPRIKKPALQVVKDLNAKVIEAATLSFKELLEICFQKEQVDQNMGEESKEGELKYDDVKVQKLLRVIQDNVQKKSLVPFKKDFRQFLKQQKLQAASNQDDVLAEIKDPSQNC